MSLLSLLLPLLFQSPLYPSQPDQVIVLRGIESPTALTRLNQNWFLLADLDNLQQGLFRATPNGSSWKASLVKALPQHQLVAFAPAPPERLLLVSSLYFGSDAKDRAGHLLELRAPEWDLLKDTTVLFDPDCPNRLPDCGLVGFWRNDREAFAVKRSSLAALYPLLLGKNGWLPQPETGLTVTRQAGDIAAVQLREGKLYALFPGLWKLGAIPFEQIQFKGLSASMALLADFRALRNPYETVQANLNSEGIASNFFLDADGTLYLLLNNRRFEYVNPELAEKGNPALILVFHPKTTP